MTAGEIVSGQQQGWSLIKKLGEGDAGEVFLVESLFEKKAGILKRPYRSAFSSDVIRQAAQIETEGKILRVLEGVTVNGPAGLLRAPRLLDQSKPGAEFSERLFIIIEKAPGADLKSLARAAHFGPENSGPAGETPDNGGNAFIENVARQGDFPSLLLLRALSSLLEFFEKIHALRVSLNNVEQLGLVWNDVKPEHLFWEPLQGCFTIIDWGNGQFLEADGTSKDRRYTRGDDYTQFIQEMGKFLLDTRPDLHAALEWPSSATPAYVYFDIANALREKITGLLSQEMENLKEARQRESAIIQSSLPSLSQVQELEEIHTRISGYGELPDTAGAETFYTRLAISLASENRLDELTQLFDQTGSANTANPHRWTLLGRIGRVVTLSSSTPAQATAVQALLAALSEEWAAALWNLASTLPDGSEPAWWDEVSTGIRQVQLEAGPDSLTPYVAVCRLSLTLQAAAIKLGDEESRKAGGTDPNGMSWEAKARLKTFSTLVQTLKEEVLPKWKQLEPDPPDSGLEYTDIERQLDGVEELLPGANQALVRSLDQPKAQVKMVMDAWGRKEFDTARKALHQVLLWDPDRRRVLLAERAILATPAWLVQVQRGPKKDEDLQDFVTHLELAGRELRNQVGPARWLDLILEAFTGLRKGTRPEELTQEHPELLNELYWLHEYEQRKVFVPSGGRPVKLEREPVTQGPDQRLRGTREGILGQDQELLLTESLDTWAPEARGSSARVFMGFLRDEASNLRQAAIKVMRPDRLDYALPLFREEAEVLTAMQDVPGVAGLVECGFIKLDPSTPLPPDDRQGNGRNLLGNVLRYGANETHAFLTALNSNVEQGWLPYVAMEKKDHEDNLMNLCDAGYNRGRFLPIKECLRMAIQICDILQAAHDRNIVYRDHKILHFYWEEVYNGIFIIDWNVAKKVSQGLSKSEKQFDLVQFGARALHHILTGRPAPGALPLGPTRPEEIERAARSYRPHWTYDDQRLSNKLKETVESVMAGGHSSVKSVREELLQSFLYLPDASD